MTTPSDPHAFHAPWRTPRSVAWHCVACGGYQMSDMQVTQPLVCATCGARGLVAARPDIDLAAHDLPRLGGTG